MKKQTSHSMDRKIISWIARESFVIICAAFLSFIFIESIAESNWFTNRIDSSIFLRALGIIIPMSIILGVLNQLMSKYTFRYVSLLINGIERIANGDFETKLDIKESGPFLPVYINFNKMAAELNNTQILRNDFINNFSHEFKTPIVSINGFAELLLKTDVSDEEKNQYLKIILDESSHLAKMADSTILLSKLNAQQIIPEKKPFSLDEQLRLCIILLSSEWTRKNIEFTGNLKPVVLWGNEETMHHLWINLLSNAIKFTPEGGKITVTLTETRKSITVEISDTGIGIKEKDITHIFDEYYQGEMIQSNQGLGLGLSIVKRIVDLYDGIIDVESTENVGSTFTVILPKK